MPELLDRIHCSVYGGHFLVEMSMQSLTLYVGLVRVYRPMSAIDRSHAHG